MRILLVLIALLATPLHAATDPSKLERQALDLVNRQRAAAGCAALEPEPRLTAAARAQAQAMATRNFFGHRGPDGSTLRTRLGAARYPWTAAGENLAAGVDDPDELVAGWMASPSHRDHILNCGFTQTGIALVVDPKDKPLRGQSFPFVYYWVQTFGRP